MNIRTTLAVGASIALILFFLYAILELLKTSLY
jgi:hypothetical protein